jgi:glycosyltransferase involved in cell wall biosynthesis
MAAPARRPPDRRHRPPRCVTVVIPVRNGAATIGAQLDALAAQTYDGRWEVLVADNGSTDGTRAVVGSRQDRLPGLRVVDVSAHAGPAYARNAAATHARGDFLAFCDADDVVEPGWLAALARAATEYDAVTGLLDASALNDDDVRAWRPARARGLPSAGFLPFAPSCNLGVWADVFERTGGFRLEYPQSEDVEWSWRMQLASFTLGFTPDAVVQYRYRTTASGIVRQGYALGVASVRLYRDYARHGFARPPLTRSLRIWGWLVLRLPYLARRRGRGIWLRRASEAAGRVAGSVRYRTLFL